MRHFLLIGLIGLTLCNGPDGVPPRPPPDGANGPTEAI